MDLGLPSGTLWANMNVGSTSPEGYGLYFAWGETQGYTVGENHTFDEYNYKYWDPKPEALAGENYTKYNWIDGKTTLEQNDDAAHVLWGGKWRMPTYEELRELLDNTSQTPTKVNDIAGIKYTSKVNGNYIFIPNTGARVPSSIKMPDSPHCWTSTSTLGIEFFWYDFGRYFKTEFAASLGDYEGRSMIGYRFWGYTIRPVQSK